MENLRRAQCIWICCRPSAQWLVQKSTTVLGNKATIEVLRHQIRTPGSQGNNVLPIPPLGLMTNAPCKKSPALLQKAEATKPLPSNSAKDLPHHPLLFGFCTKGISIMAEQAPASAETPKSFPEFTGQVRELRGVRVVWGKGSRGSFHFPLFPGIRIFLENHQTPRGNGQKKNRWLKINR